MTTSDATGDLRDEKRGRSPRTAALSEISLVLGAAVLGFVALVVIVNAIVLILGGAVHPATTLACAVLIVTGVAWVLRGRSWGARLITIVVLAALLVSAAALAGITRDYSWDGNTYHKVAIGALANGWNPVWESVVDFNAGTGNPVQVPATHELWVDHYAKATWIFGGSVYQVTGAIESGKAIGLLTMAAVFFITAGYVSTRLALWPGIVIGAIAALNPVAVGQVFTAYNDAVLGNLLIVVVVLLTMLVDPGWSPPRPWNAAYWPTLAGAFILLANVKFTGLLYAGLFGLSYLAVLLLRPRANRAKAIGLAAVGAGAALVAVFVVGATSYVRNIAVRGNPLYPLLGADRVDIISDNQPDAFADMAPIVRFLGANFSKTTNNWWDDSPMPIKIPFGFTMRELQELGTAAFDMRLGGYGVWFGGILLLSIALGLYLLIRHGRAHRDLLPLFLTPAAATAIGVILFEESWWARYTPHLVLLPLLVIAGLFAVRARVLPWLLSALMVINVGLTVRYQVSAQAAHTWFAPTLAEQVESLGDDCPALYSGITVYDVESSGALYNFVDAVPGVRILTTEEFTALDPDDFVEMPYASTRVYTGSCASLEP